MKKLMAAVVALMFGLGSVTAFAADPPKTDAERKEARDMKAAKAKEDAAAKKAKKKEEAEAKKAKKKEASEKARAKREAAAKERSEMKNPKK
jgi:hypothetical protein